MKITLSIFQFALLMAFVNTIFYNFIFFSKIYLLYEGILIQKLIFLTVLATIVILFYTAFFSLVIIKYFTKYLFALIFIINALVIYFISTYNIIIDEYMIINAVETHTTEIKDLLQYQLFLYLIFLGIIPSLLLSRIEIVYKSFLKDFVYKVIYFSASLAIAVIILFIFFKDISSFFRNHGKVLRGILVPYSYVEAIIYTAIYFNKENYTFTKLSEDAKLGELWQAEDKKKTIFIFILGETARVANFSLNGYDRNTNEPLEKNKKDLIIFNNTTSCGTSTSISLPCIFSHLDRENFNIRKASYYENLLDIIETTSFNVSWLTNNGGCKGVCKRVQKIDLTNKSFCAKGNCHDSILVEHLEKEIKKSSSPEQFYVLNMLGSHGPTYYLRYPKEFKKFTPTCETANLKDCTLEKVKNTYDNTIYYTSHVLNQTIEFAKKQKDSNMVVLYISDHGESLGEKGFYLHGFPYGLSPAVQREIPFIMWLSPSFENKFIKNKDCLHNIENGEYSHDNIFHSVLGLLNIQSSSYKKELDIFAQCS